jgi:hypothetical protein
MANPLSGLDLGDWYKAALLVALVVLLGAMAAKRDDIAVVATGVLIHCFGQWINHPTRSGVGGGFILTSTSRLPSFGGLALEGIGLLLVIYGVWKML